MGKYGFIFVGGAVGGTLRFGVKNSDLFKFSGDFPLATLFVNMAGSFLLALFLVMAFEAASFNSDLHLGIAPGLLGGFTTFSTICKEGSLMIFSGDFLMAIFYLSISLILGLGSAYLGYLAAKKIVLKRGRAQWR